MRDYDRSLPLIIIHIPKTAGTSTKEFFRRWYGDRLYENYFDQGKGELPVKRDLASLHTVEKPIAVYGHFNRPRGFGIEHYYPEVSQFITILRDPFERAISTYFFMRRVGTAWNDQSRVPRAELREYLRTTRSNMFNHFPRVVTKDNFRDMIEEYFIEIGLMEHLAESMERIAAKLSMPYDPKWLPHLNPSIRNQENPADLREEYIEQHSLEYQVYDYVLARFKQAQRAGPGKRIRASALSGPQITPAAVP